MSVEIDNIETGKARICRIYVSAGHNYFGHHGVPAGENPIVPVTEVECVPGRGLRGDRFFDFKPDYKGQITFFDWAVFVTLCRELEIDDVDPGALRRNVMVQGLDLLALIGQDFEMQGVRFKGIEECRPCYWMNHALHPKAEQWLQGRGGLRATILSHGWLRLGKLPAADVTQAVAHVI
jgi:MOSC domain-containing protein YiiM